MIDFIYLQKIYAIIYMLPSLSNTSVLKKTILLAFTAKQR